MSLNYKVEEVSYVRVGKGVTVCCVEVSKEGLEHNPEYIGYSVVFDKTIYDENKGKDMAYINAIKKMESSMRYFDKQESKKKQEKK